MYDLHEPQVLANGSYSNISKTLFPPTLLTLLSPHPKKNCFWKSRKVKNKCSQGQQNTQAISIEDAYSHTIRVFDSTHQCFINMQPKLQFTLYNAGGVYKALVLIPESSFPLSFL